MKIINFDTIIQKWVLRQEGVLKEVFSTKEEALLFEMN